MTSSSKLTRYDILPCYPTTSDSSHDRHLLLANMPMHQLDQADLEHRQHHGYHEPSATTPINDHERLLLSLSRLWNVRRDILEFNLKRLIRYLHVFATHRIRRFATASNDEYLREHDFAVALEFFLQFDRDLFYMKTCAYRDAQPFIYERHLFCTFEPHGRYAITPCRQLTCCLCYPSYNVTYRQTKPVIKFGPHQQHTFMNGYRSILNCPATCTTKCLIYVLTCPCQQVDYIGETRLSLADRLSYHQAHGNRIIQESLLGSNNVARIVRRSKKSFETLVQDGMKLYQHSARCPFALQLFLDENPDYWPFIPTKMTLNQEHEEERELTSLTDNNTQLQYANNVPTPPNSYRFSDEQKLAIETFFLEKKYLNSPNRKLDLYQANIVAVLPIYASDTLRRIIEALFITQAQTQLNSIGHLDQILSTDIPSATTATIEPDSIIWCQDLIRRT